jgi:hypothetical protein
MLVTSLSISSINRKYLEQNSRDDKTFLPRVYNISWDISPNKKTLTSFGVVRSKIFPNTDTGFCKITF